MASVVNVNITGNDELSAIMTRSGEAVQRFGQTVNAQTAPLQRYEQGAIKARAALGPLSSGIQELTGVMRQQSPAAAAVVGAVDNLSISMLSAVASTGSWAGALRVLSGLLNPWVGLVVAGGAALAYFAGQSKEAAKAQEDFNTAMRSGNIDFFKDKLKTANDELRKTEEHFEKILKLQEQQLASAPGSGPLARAQEAGLERQRKLLGEVSAAAQQAGRDVETVRRTKAEEGLPEIDAALAAQLKLSQARERDKPIVEAQIAIEKLRASGLSEESVAIRATTINQIGLAKQREIDSKAAEEAAKKSTELNQRQQEAVGKTRDEIAKLNLTLVEQAEKLTLVQGPTLQLKLAIVEQEDATKRAAFANDKLLTPSLITLLDKLKQQKIDEVNAAEAIKQKEIATRRANLVMQEQLNLLNLVAEANSFVPAMYANLQRIEQERIQSLQNLGNAQADYLQLIGKTREAEQLRLQTTIQNLQELRKQADSDTSRAVLDQQIVNAQTALQKVGDVTIDIGQHVSRSIDDMFTALISGTLKAVDVGKAATGTLGRIVADMFSQTIKDKLKFELNLFNNVKALPGQLNGAIASGGGGGGILQTLLFGSGGGASPFSNVLASTGGIIQLDPNTVFSSAGGSGGGGGGVGGILGSLMSGLSSLWSLLPTSITTAITTTATAAMTALNSSIMALASNPITWIAAAVVAAVSIIYRVIANQKERPNATFGADINLSFDPMTGEFSPGEVGVSIGRKVGIKNSQAGQIATALQESVQVLAQQWVDILNIFPDTIKNKIAPALDEVNAILNQQFNRLKFSPGGSRNIQEELADIAGGVGGQSRFFAAFRGILASGFGASLTQAGIPGVSTAGFANMPGAANREGFDFLIEQITNVTTMVSQLARTNAAQFLTGAEVDALSEIFDALFSTSDVQAFSNMAAKLEEMLKPVMDAIEQAMQQSAEVFGRGIMAALEAVSESDAQVAFFASFNQGLKEAVFSGITSAVLASAQFNGLLAPLQQKIREAVESALDTGTFDRMEFQSAILPAIETILSRVEMLRPLIDELQRFGSNINQRLGLVEPEEVAEPIAEGLTESATLFGQSLITAMEAATQSQAMTDFTAAFNTGIKDAVFSGLVESFLATGVVDQMLAPIRAAITQAVTESQTTGAFAFPDVTQLVANASAAASTWQPLIEIMQQFAFGIRDMLGLVPPAEVAPVTPAPVNVTINLNGTGNVDQGSIPELARRLNFMLEPALAPRA